MKLRDTEKTATKEQNSFSRVRRTLCEGLATLALSGVLTACGGAQTNNPQRTVPTAQQHIGTGSGEEEQLRESHVVVLPDEPQGTRLRAAVLEYEPSRRSLTPIEEQELSNAEHSCIGQGNHLSELLTDVRRHMQMAMGEFTEFVSSVYQLRNGNSVQGARLAFEYFAPDSGSYSSVPGCEQVNATTRQIVQFPQLDTQPAREVPVYFAECDISGVIGSGGTYIRITFVPQSDQNISPSSAQYEYRRQ